MNLVIDIGNSSVKWAVFNDRELHSNGRVDRMDDVNWSALREITIDRAIVSNVTQQPLSIPEEVCRNVIEFSRSLAFPIDLAYTTPETLGQDRLCNAIALHHRFPNQPALSIDIGTCVKFDMINNGIYLGGSISPGLHMRCEALHQFTGKLPKIEPQHPTPLTGTSTYAAMNSGVVNGMIGEINGMIEQYSREFDDLQIVGTGGDFNFFADALKSSIFADNFLTLRGLNDVLAANE